MSKKSPIMLSQQVFNQLSRLFELPEYVMALTLQVSMDELPTVTITRLAIEPRQDAREVTETFRLEPITDESKTGVST